jgi:ketosteroid isomerase-like protein
MAHDAAKTAATYFDAWKVNDFDTMRSLVDDDVTLSGPLAQLEGAEGYMRGIKGMSQITSDIVIQKVFVDGPDVLTWYDLHTTVADPVPVANWIHVEEGKITSLKVAFDARGLVR